MFNDYDLLHMQALREEAEHERRANAARPEHQKGVFQSMRDLAERLLTH